MSVYADQVQVDLALLRPGGQVIHLAPDPMQQLTTAENAGEDSMRLEAIVPNVPTDAGPLHELLPINAVLRLSASYGDGMQPVQDFVVRRRRFIDDGHEQLYFLAYDPLWEVNKDECVLMFLKPTNLAMEIIRTVCNPPDGSRHIPLSTGAASGPITPIWQRRFVGMSRLAVIKQVLQWAWQRADPSGPDKNPWFVQWRDGALTILQPGSNAPIYVLRDADSVSYYDHDTSIEDLVTEVFIFSPEALKLSSNDPQDDTYGMPFGAILPDPSKNYAQLAQVPGGDSTASPQTQIAQEATDLFALADFQKAQDYARIRKVIQASDTDNIYLVYQQALDILNLQGIPWDIKTIECPLMPRLRRGDAIAVEAGDMPPPPGNILIVTGVEHDFTEWKTHVTVDSSGIFGRRVRRQHFLGPLPGQDGDLVEEDLQAMQSSTTTPYVTQGYLNWTRNGSPAPTTLPDPRGVTQSFNGFDPTVDPGGFTQHAEWTCSAASTTFLLHTLGYTNMTEEQVVHYLGTSRINSSSGLLDASGAGLKSMLGSAPFNLNAHSDWLTYDQILDLAGKVPLVIGGVGWNHWTAVRGRDGDNLLLMNPAPGYKGIGQTLTRADASRLGPFGSAWVTPAAPSS